MRPVNCGEAASSEHIETFLRGPTFSYKKSRERRIALSSTEAYEMQLPRMANEAGIYSRTQLTFFRDLFVCANMIAYGIL